MSIEVIHIIEQLCREKGIDKDFLIDAVKTAVEAAARKKLPHVENIVSQFNIENGDAEIWAEKSIVEALDDPENQIMLEEAIKISPDAQLGETVLVKQEIRDLGRIAAQLAKQVILQKVREAEIEITYNEYQERKGDLINGIVQRFEHGDIIVELGKAEGVLPRREQVFRETFNRGDRIRAYVVDIRKTSKNALVILSRTHIGLIQCLFELEVPEISEGMVEIMGIVREPNGRTKIAVRSNDRDIDAVGACVGMRGMRVQSIVQELRGEKIDIVEYSEDPEVFIRNALSPAKISRIISNKDENHMTIIVADDQMSLAIGKKGQNVRLAAKLVKWKIDIKNQSESGGGLLEASGLMPRKEPSTEDFLEIIKNAKGFGEKIVAILFTNNVVNFDEVVNRGIEGLTQITGIGPKKAEAIFEFSQNYISQRPEVIPVAEETPEDENDEDTVSQAEEAEAVEEEDQEFPVSDLAGVDPSIIQILESNGFQTIAELSVTPTEELVVLEGIDEELATSLVEQARLHMEKFENV
ncbi:MAG: transcription termination factor NusA [Nitrospinota bacterium]|nr:transcription termination factor NusA [Nitrospinota bacterium]MDH5788955.1 transcription termination factor NusA [Nitrospinota bacterium]